MKPSTEGNIVSPLEVQNTLRDYREILLKDPKVATIQEGISAFNDHCRPFGLEASPFDPNRVYLLPAERINEIHPNPNHLAVILGNRTRDILIPIDSAELEDPDALFDVIVHEAGHDARRVKQIDDFHSNGSYLLEEGIIQANAKVVENNLGRESDRGSSVYYLESWVAAELAKSLGEVSLIGMSHADIRRRVNETYSYLVPSDVEPYDILSDDLVKAAQIWDKAIEQIGLEGEDISEERLDEIRSGIGREKGEMGRLTEKWRFGSGKTETP